MSHASAGPNPDLNLDLILNIFSGTLQQVSAAVADIPDSLLAEQPDGLVNHPAWTLSHLNTAAGFIIQLLGGTDSIPSPDEAKSFGPGSTPTADRTLYRSKSDLLAQLSHRHALAEAIVRERHAAHFPRETPPQLRNFAPTIGRIIVYLLATHESYHLGQLQQWRRAAGLKTT